MEQGDEVHTVVVLPSRELAIQVNLIAGQIATAVHTSKSILLIGGYPIEKDLQRFKEEKPRILVGTPGRMFEFVQQSKLSLKGVEFLVLDEGDKLLELADSAKLLKIIAMMPSTRTVALFSATISQNLEKLISINLAKALQVKVPVFTGEAGLDGILAPASGEENDVQFTQLSKLHMVEQGKENAKTACELPQAMHNYHVVLSDQMKKLDTMRWFLDTYPHAKTIVFISTCSCVEFYYHLFLQLFPELKTAVTFDRLHRKMSQKKRDKIYGKFLTASEGMLLCTDILSRGIDIPDLQWIIQYDPPQHSDSFLHRVGRTARAGKQGSVNMTFLLC